MGKFSFVNKRLNSARRDTVSSGPSHWGRPLHKSLLMKTEAHHCIFPLVFRNNSWDQTQYSNCFVFMCLEVRRLARLPDACAAAAAAIVSVVFHGDRRALIKPSPQWFKKIKVVTCCCEGGTRGRPSSVLISQV